MRLGIVAISACLIQLCLACTTRADPVCSPGMTPANCAEAQLAAIGTIFGQYKNEVARVDNEISNLKDTIMQQQARFDGLLKAMASPQNRTKDCDGGACTASCQNDEILISGLCLVPGAGENGTGFLQNVGHGEGLTWSCAFAVAPQVPKKVRAVAWCAKIP